jgi:hypothetical protein
MVSHTAWYPTRHGIPHSTGTGVTCNCCASAACGVGACVVGRLCRPPMGTGLGPLEAFALASALRALRPCLLHRLDVSGNSLYAEAVAELCLSTSSAPLERWGRPAPDRLSVACCMLHSVCESVAHCMLNAACCMLHSVCESVARCMLNAACCMLHSVCESVARCTLHVECCMLEPQRRATLRSSFLRTSLVCTSMCKLASVGTYVAQLGAEECARCHVLIRPCNLSRDRCGRMEHAGTC